MAAAEQSSDPVRDYGSPATWGDVEAVRNALAALEHGTETRLARLEGRSEMRIAEVRSEVAELRADLVRFESKIDVQIAEVRADLSAMESRFNAQIAEVRADFNAQIAEVRADISAMDGRFDARLAALQTEIARGNERMVRWTLTAVVAGVAAITALVGILAAI